MFHSSHTHVRHSLGLVLTAYINPTNYFVRMGNNEQESITTAEIKYHFQKIDFNCFGIKTNVGQLDE